MKHRTTEMHYEHFAYDVCAASIMLALCCFVVEFSSNYWQVPEDAAVSVVSSQDGEDQGYSEYGDRYGYGYDDEDGYGYDSYGYGYDDEDGYGYDSYGYDGSDDDYYGYDDSDSDYYGYDESDDSDDAYYYRRGNRFNNWDDSSDDSGNYYSYGDSGSFQSGIGGLGGSLAA